MKPLVFNEAFQSNAQTKSVKFTIINRRNIKPLLFLATWVVRNGWVHFLEKNPLRICTI